MRGHAVRVVALAESAGPDRIARAMPRPSRIPRTIALLTAAARESDVILATGLWAEAAIAARLAGCPLVARIPGDPAWERALGAGLELSIEAFQTGRLPRRWAALRRARSAWTRAATHVLVPSAWLKQLVTGWGVPESRITVIANAAAAQPGGVADHDLVWAGRFVPQKRLPALVEAARQASASLLLIGDGPAAPPAAPHVTRAPPVAPPPLWRGRIHVQASSYEGHPHTLIEAMQAGRPVIATDAGGTRECFTHGVHGLLVPPGDDAALTDAIRTLLKNPARAVAMGEAGQAHAREHFGVERMLDATETLLRRVAAR
jgi:glycosyltransferase involved in cell wall biosynthesis